MGGRFRAVSAFVAAYLLSGLGFGQTAVAAPIATPAGVDLSEYRGRIVYVDFWASWCVPCRQSFPWMNGLQKQFGKDGLVIVAVNMDQVHADAENFLKQYPADFSVRFDPQGLLAQQFKVRGMPTSALLGRDGQVLWTHEGFRSKDPQALEQSIRSALH